MPLNLTKKYPELLDLSGAEEDSLRSLRSVFRRDIEDNTSFLFRKERILPLKSSGIIDMDRLFDHLTHKTSEQEGVKHRNIFDKARSERLHWLRTHIEERVSDEVEVFTLVERNKGKDAVKTYLWNRGKRYVVVLEHQRHGGYYLLTAYYLSEEWGEQTIQKKFERSKKTLP